MLILIIDSIFIGGASVMKALVTTASTPTSLFVVRRLKELGYKVTIVDSHNRSFISYSNAVSKRIVAPPSLLYDPHGFAKAVLDELRQGGDIAFIFPVLECGFYCPTIKTPSNNTQR